MLYLSPVPFEELGFDSRLGKTPMPMLTMSALSKVPNVLSVGGVLLAGIWWITNRRTEVQAYESSLNKKVNQRHEDEEGKP
jgi:formate dehydrogenase iron-sulfur subunit